MGDSLKNSFRESTLIKHTSIKTLPITLILHNFYETLLIWKMFLKKNKVFDKIKKKKKKKKKKDKVD